MKKISKDVFVSVIGESATNLLENDRRFEHLFLIKTEVCLWCDVDSADDPYHEHTCEWCGGPRPEWFYVRGIKERPTLKELRVGNQNVFIGYDTTLALTTGNQNMAIGVDAFIRCDGIGS